MPDIPEEVIRRFWESRITRTTPLTTSDGIPVRILFNGTPNLDGGPDFLDALVRIGNCSYHGDIEIHRSPEDWYAHGHDTDPHYNRVVLHVVAGSPARAVAVRTAARRTLPLLILDHTLLNSTVPEPVEPRETLLTSITLRLNRCRSPRMFLQRKGWERIQNRIERLEHRVKQLFEEGRHAVAEPEVRYEGSPGEIPVAEYEWTRAELRMPWVWEQVLYEVIMEACGYSRNAAPFLALARNVPLITLRMHRLEDPVAMMALLFGAAGLLPVSTRIPQGESRTLVRRLRRKWNTARRITPVQALHETDWLFFRLRPANFPTARLAAMVFLLPGLFSPGAFHRIRMIVSNGTGSPRQRLSALRRLFHVAPNEYWRRHLRFNATSTSMGASLGRQRIDTVLLNGVLPLILLYARLTGDAGLGRSGRSILRAVPSSHETRLLEAVRRMLCPEGKKRLSGQEQQGVIRMMEEAQQHRKADARRANGPLRSGCQG
ncbi:MAG: DUF2851 family protein [Bacteroidetes bacterium]|nr:DUF2851 family protein [Bacteroidota bacterium]